MLSVVFVCSLFYIWLILKWLFVANILLFGDSYFQVFQLSFDVKFFKSRYLIKLNFP